MDDTEETADLPPRDGAPAKRKRPRLMPELRSLARSKTSSAINVLFRIMLNEKASPRVRMAAANSILDRGWGRPVQAIEAGETPLQVIHRIERVIVDPNNPQPVRMLDLSSQPMIPELPYDDHEDNDHFTGAAIDRKPIGSV